MNDIDDTVPELTFLRATPQNLMSRPPLASSLQNTESSFFLIALGRFPHALVTCGSAIESAMKSVLAIDSEKFINADKLYKTASSRYSALSAFDLSELETFRFSRNRIVHYGFSPRDDEETARLLLRTGYPFLMACYKEFFGFDLVDGLLVEFGEQFNIALDVYTKAKDLPQLNVSYCFRAFGHLVRWSIRQSLMPGWENDASIHADENGLKFDHCEKQKWKLGMTFRASWNFDCPICDDISTFVCELDEDCLDDHVISLKRGACPSCSLVVPHGCPYLVDALCREQIAAKRDEILQGYGIT
jgi:hypothetical protein